MRGKIDIGANKVKDIKEVKKEQQLAKDAKRAQDFNWNISGNVGGERPQPAAGTSDQAKAG
jgi:hypothetical protein